MRARSVSTLAATAVALSMATAAPASAAGGDLRWRQSTNLTPTGSSDVGDLAVGTDGTIYAAGGGVTDSGGSQGTRRFAVTALASDGAERWHRAYQVDDESGFANALAVDDVRGQVIAVGRTTTGVNVADGAVVAFDAATGQPRWAQTFDSTPQANDSANAVAVDGRTGTVYVAGVGELDGFDQDTLVFAYSATGTLLWTREFATNVEHSDIPISVALDGSGNLYVGTRSYSDNFMVPATGFSTVLSYAPDGALRWTVRTASAPHTVNNVGSLAVDRTRGRIYVSGYQPRPDGSIVALTRALSPNGVTLWTATYRRDGARPNVLTGGVPSLDPSSGTVYVLVNDQGVGTGNDLTTVAYDPYGNRLWDRTLPSSRGESGRGLAAADDGTGVYLIGSQGLNSDVVLAVHYTADGTLAWTSRVEEGPRARGVGPRSIALDTRLGQVYLGGSLTSVENGQVSVALALAA